MKNASPAENLLMYRSEQELVQICTPIYMYIHTYTSIHISRAVRVFGLATLSVHVYSYTHIHIYTYTHMHIYTHISRAVRVFGLATLSVHVYTYTHIHIYTYTHIHTYI